ncbi:rhomboid family intramembrane serine protease [Candidatus Woesearchaeota archaeon]|nr:rhomboid family intramembrane serine protease [Candidatus Woesearchaeota archaeon]
MTIVLVNVILALLQVFVSGFTEAFLLDSSLVWSEPWRLLTSMFLHGGFGHILFNMYALFIFGSLIEQRIGTKRFVFIYFLSGILAAVLSTFFYERALGASGAIMGILGVTIILMPDLRVLFFFMIPMSLRTAGIIFALVDIFGIFYSSGVANIAHLVGLACGLVYGFYLLKRKKSFQKRFYKGPKITVESPRDNSSKDIFMSNKDIDDYLRYGKL